jgi:hypothetical protein
MSVGSRGGESEDPGSAALRSSGASRTARLGLNANTTAALPVDSVSRLEKWHLQSVARFLVPKERVRLCFRARIPDRDGVDVYYSPVHGSAHYGGLQVCGSVWMCPVCAARVAERRRELLTRALAAATALGGRPLLVSYTFRHRGHQHTLAGALGAFLASQSAMAGHRAYRRLLESCGVLGTVKALEVTWGRRNGWHPHSHVIMFAPAEIDPDRLEAALYAIWSREARRHRLSMTRERGVVVQRTDDRLAGYVAKWGHAPSRRLWGAEDELTKSHSKRSHQEDGYTPFDLLRWLVDTGESQAAVLFRDYAATFKGRRQLTWTPGLADLLGVGAEAAKSDEQLAVEVREDAPLLATLTPAEWRAVLALDERGQLLEVARSGDVVVFREYINRLVFAAIAASVEGVA